jgi:hypothetical protein
MRFSNGMIRQLALVLKGGFRIRKPTPVLARVIRRLAAVRDPVTGMAFAGRARQAALGLLQTCRIIS